MDFVGLLQACFLFNFLERDWHAPRQHLELSSWAWAWEYGMGWVGHGFIMTRELFFLFIFCCLTRNIKHPSQPQAMGIYMHLFIFLSFLPWHYLLDCGCIMLLQLTFCFFYVFFFFFFLLRVHVRVPVRVRVRVRVL